MTNEEFILLFKRDSGMSEAKWKRFCKRYAYNDISNLVDIIKKLYRDTGLNVPVSFRKSLRQEMKRHADVSGKGIFTLDEITVPMGV